MLSWALPLRRRVVTLQERIDEVVRHADVGVAHDDAEALAGTRVQRRVRRILPVDIERHVPGHELNLADRPLNRSFVVGTVENLAGQARHERQRADGDYHEKRCANREVSCHPTSNPVAYMTPNPARSPTITGAVANRSDEGSPPAT